MPSPSRSTAPNVLNHPQTSFLTPAELFSPWYGYILARHMLEHRKHNLGLVRGSGCLWYDARIVMLMG